MVLICQIIFYSGYQLKVRFLCTDGLTIGIALILCADELAHLEMIGAIVYQLTRNLTPKEIQDAGFDAYFVDHTTGIYPSSAAGVPFTAAYIQSKGDPLTDLHEDLAADAIALKEQHF